MLTFTSTNNAVEQSKFHTVHELELIRKYHSDKAVECGLEADYDGAVFHAVQAQFAKEAIEAKGDGKK